MADHYEDFPFEMLLDPHGDLFNSWDEAKAAGYDDDQIWSVVQSDDDEEVITHEDGSKSVNRTATTTYGPPHHYVNRVGHLATAERHDNETYYHEVESWEIDYDPEIHGEDEDA